MEHLQVGVVDGAPAELPQPQAVVDVVVVDRELLAEAAELLEQLAPGHQAGGGNGEAVVGDPHRVGVAAEVAAEAPVVVAGEAVLEADADVLQALVFSEQAGADGADPLHPGVHDHPLDPVRRRHLDVVIEQQQVLAAGHGGTGDYFLAWHFTISSNSHAL